MWKLVIEDEEGKRTVVPLTREEYSIGRKEGNTIRLTERNVSRTHAVIRRARNGAPANEANLHGATYLLEDQTSYNGVHINGARVAERQELSHGDLIQIGDYRLVVQDDAVADATIPGGGALIPGASASAAGGARATMPSGAVRASLQIERPDRLVMLAGPTPGAEFFLDRERLTIGRAEDASISVNHNSVSRMHCEVHALGGGRFELIDKGSSNGVRVNSTDLRRGIVEAGDVIELGDVKFKFVGAGQIFLPGVNDSQELAAIQDREATAIVGGKRGLGLGAYSLFAVVIAGAAFGAWHLTHAEKGSNNASSAQAATSPAEEARKNADDQCLAGDCDAAHENLVRAVAADSPLRDSPIFKRVVTTWADSILARASGEPDPSKKRALLGLVSRAPEVDAVKRKAAADALEQVDDRAMNPNVLPVALPREAPPAASPPPPTARPDAGARRAPAPTQATVAAADPPAASPPPAKAAPPPGGDLERARALVLQGTSGASAARAILEPKVTAGRASPEEIRMLKAICKEQHDQACVERCKSLL